MAFLIKDNVLYRDNFEPQPNMSFLSALSPEPKQKGSFVGKDFRRFILSFKTGAMAKLKLCGTQRISLKTQWFGLH